MFIAVGRRANAIDLWNEVFVQRIRHRSNDSCQAFAQSARAGQDQDEGERCVFGISAGFNEVLDSSGPEIGDAFPDERNRSQVSGGLAVRGTVERLDVMPNGVDENALSNNDRQQN